MPFPLRHHRRSIRVPGYDYAQPAAYFLTICTHRRERSFGSIVQGAMILNDVGLVVRDEWKQTAMIRREVELDQFVIMPNHLHAIVRIIAGIQGGAGRSDGTSVGTCSGDRPVAPTGPRPRSVGSLIAGFKSATTRRINDIRRTPGAPVWQRNYYEQIIRTDESLAEIRQYIANNPAKWAEDENNPDRRR